MPVKRRKKVRNEKTHVAYLVTWSEYERGWGCRPDGASLHLTQEDVKKYIAKYNASLPLEVPDEYSAADTSTGRLVAISPSLYKHLKNSKKHNGMMLWQTEYRKLLSEGKITK